MGHYVEYLVELNPAAAREWMSQFDGFWLESETVDNQLSGEFSIGEDLDVVAYVGPLCRLTVPQIKYSPLIAEDAEVTAKVDKLDLVLVKTLPGVCILRIDELMLDQWEAETGRPWHQIPNPFAAILAWLEASHQNTAHYRVLGQCPRDT